ncbi:30S ribosomal protein S5 [Candidatus Uhrbacteria bacterium]|nr:30S ribosomal protein S5 [Candidatus Uhrbacteria bacterium]
MQQQRGRRRSSGRSRDAHEPKEFEQKVLEVARVTRVTAGGKRMRFRALVVIGDGKGRVAAAAAKGSDVSQAIAKSTERARKMLWAIPMTSGTIPHRVQSKYGSSVVLLKPAPVGTGIIAGGVVRQVLEIAGVGNIVSKMLGSHNKLNTVRATIKALQALRTATPSRRVSEAQSKA